MGVKEDEALLMDLFEVIFLISYNRAEGDFPSSKFISFVLLYLELLLLIIGVDYS